MNKLLLVNVDDVSGELVPHTIDGLMSRGAGSVHVVQAITKKGRLEYLFFVDAPGDTVEHLADFMARELGTLGVRVFDPQHIQYAYYFGRVRLSSRVGLLGADVDVRVKQLCGPAGDVISVKAEADDLSAVLRVLDGDHAGITFKGLKRLVEQAAESRAPCFALGLEACLLEGDES